MLSGGRSRRLGADKRRLRHANGESVLARLVATLRDTWAQVRLVGAAPLLEGAGACDVTRDQWPGLGAPGAVRSALITSAPGWVAVYALDLPNIGGAEIEALALAVDRAERRAPWVRVVAPFARGRGQPLAAAWHTSALSAWPAPIEPGGRAPSLHAWSRAAGASWFLSPRDAAFDDVDEPADLDAAGLSLETDA